MGWATFWAILFKNSSGHSASVPCFCDGTNSAKASICKKKILIGPLYESYTFVKKNVSWFYARLARVLFQEPILRPRITTPAFIFFTTALGSLERFGNKNILLNSEKRSSLLQRWRCSCKFKSRRIGSKFEYFGPYTTPGAQ
jgi:hypothetical protein